MRTTITLDDDLAGALKQWAANRGISFKEAVNSAIRAGLGQEVAARPGNAPKTKPHRFGFRADIDLDKLNQLADDLETDEVSRGLRKSV
jgi:hypothetical protein